LARRGAGEAGREVSALPEGHRLLGPVVRLHLRPLDGPGILRRGWRCLLLSRTAGEDPEQREDGQGARGAHIPGTYPTPAVPLAGPARDPRVGDSRLTVPHHDLQPAPRSRPLRRARTRVRPGHRLVRTREPPGPIPTAAAGGREPQDRLVLGNGRCTGAGR